MRARENHFIVRTAAFLLTVCLVLPAFSQKDSTQKKGGGPAVLMLDFQNTKDADRYRASRMAEHFKSVSRSAVPPGKQAWTVHLNYAKENEPQIFTAKALKRKHDITITIPRKVTLWQNDPMAHNWLMSMMIMANLGEPFRDGEFERVNHIRSHWLVRGLARKAASTADPIQSPFTWFYPCAWVLGSNGMYPTVKQIVSGSLEGFQDAAADEFESEYPCLLTDALSAAGFFRKKMAEPLLRGALAIPDADPYQAFFAVATELKIQTGPEPLTDEILDAWFRTYVERTQVSFFSPYSTEYFETVYRKTTTFRFTDPDGIPQTCRIATLAENWKFLPNANEQTDMLIARLKALTFQAPAGFQDDLSAIRLALARIRTDRSPEAVDALKNTEKKLFERIAQRVTAERLLADAEARFFPPAKRFERTLDTVRMERDNTHLLLPRLQSTLDRWDDYK